MAKTIDFSGVKGSDWYTRNNFTGADLVTHNASNRDLGIKDIRLNKPNGTHARVKANVVIELVNDIQLFGTLYEAKDGQHFTFGVDQRKYKTDNGGTGYADINVRIPLAVQAQVMRYAETRTTNVPVQVAPTQTAMPIVEEVAEVIQEASQEAPSTKQDLASMLEGASPEEIARILNTVM